MTLEGVRYVNWCLGSPREMKNQTRLVAGTGILLLLDDVAWAPPQWTYWSEYYDQHPRDTSVTELAPWVRDIYEKMFQLRLPPKSQVRYPRPSFKGRDPSEIYLEHGTRMQDGEATPAKPPISDPTTTVRKKPKKLSLSTTEAPPRPDTHDGHKKLSVDVIGSHEVVACMPHLKSRAVESK
eukprot:CAMPEP_0185759608 /NCGR_PEP_ID=MMETSP1174-20130828/18356_1 /TAXON_ID=35687 /ORGANISM="Dictyocha speculum, Strain CCMP1381" /LENGTH=180 /DNA_ID=CAMNT_0028440003 /DNA_START=104 /DNA_END=647 /DNA_ORIENTATION=+